MLSTSCATLCLTWGLPAGPASRKRPNAAEPRRRDPGTHGVPFFEQLPHCDSRPANWAWVTADGRQDWASARRSTYNRMELVAVLELLRSHPDQPLLVLSDSQYVINVFTKWLRLRDREMLLANSETTAGRESGSDRAGLRSS